MRSLAGQRPGAQNHPGAQGQLAFFADNVPRRPYASDNPQEHGVWAMSAVRALELRYIQYNPPATAYWLVFDIDRDCRGDWPPSPMPNITAHNPANGHAHFFYGLAYPVTRTSLGRAAPLRLLENVHEALRHDLGGDPDYAELIAKNPCHSHWQVETPRVELYGLGELAEYVDLIASAKRIKATPKRQRSGVGRNVSLFDSLRVWTYKEIHLYRAQTTWAGFDGWADLVADKARRFNIFANPLPEAETRGIGRSVAKWVWNQYTGRRNGPEADYIGLPANTFSMVQSSLGKMGMESRWGDNTAKQIEARKMKAGGLTQAEIAEQLEVSQATVSRWLKVAGL